MESLYKCVWMTAGVLTFRLCDRGYDCERCLVDLALREGGAPPPDLSLHEGCSQPRSVGGTVGSQSTGFHVPTGGFLHPAHLQVQVIDGGKVRIGLDGFARRLLGRVREISLPMPGSILRRGQLAWKFVGEAGRVGLPSPLGGRVVARNDRLLADPAILARCSPYNLWLASLRPTRLGEGLGRLLYGKGARVWWREELEALHRCLLDARVIESGTLPDGGEIDPALLDRIEPTLRCTLVQRLLLRRTRRSRGGSTR